MRVAQSSKSSPRSAFVSAVTTGTPRPLLFFGRTNTSFFCRNNKNRTMLRVHIYSFKVVLRFFT